MSIDFRQVIGRNPKEIATGISFGHQENLRQQMANGKQPDGPQPLRYPKDIRWAVPTLYESQSRAMAGEGFMPAGLTLLQNRRTDKALEEGYQMASQQTKSAVGRFLPRTDYKVSNYLQGQLDNNYQLAKRDITLGRMEERDLARDQGLSGAAASVASAQGTAAQIGAGYYNALNQQQQYMGRTGGPLGGIMGGIGGAAGLAMAYGQMFSGQKTNTYTPPSPDQPYNYAPQS